MIGLVSESLEGTLSVLSSEVSDLSQGFSIGAHISQDDQDVFLTLIGQELSGGQRQSRSDDAFNPERRN